MFNRFTWSLTLMCLFLISVAGSFSFAYSYDTHDNSLTNPSPQIIKEIYIQGNKKTATYIVKYYLNLDTGTVYDSMTIRKAKERLRATDLFLKVDIVTLFKQDGAHIYVILIEGLFFMISDIGGTYSLQKYGNLDFWYRLNLGVEQKNFRGKMETLRVVATFWDYRALSLSWTKPLIPYPYFLNVTLGAYQYPEDAHPVEHQGVFLRGSFGRRFSNHFSLYMGLTPAYDKIRIISTTSSKSTDSLLLPSSQSSYQVYSNLSSVIDYRNEHFDVKKGWYLYSDIKTNALYPDQYRRFTLLTNDFRWYTPLYGDHRLASRIFTQFRNFPTAINSNRQNGDVSLLQYGGEGSLRGYYRDEFPHKFKVNDAFIFSCEYRFPLIHFPPMKVPILHKYIDLFQALEYRLDGALIFDYGRMSSTFNELLNLNNNKIDGGTGIGFGLRAMVPTIKKSASFDLVWGEDPSTSRGNIRFNLKYPKFYFYVDLLN